MRLAGRLARLLAGMPGIHLVILSVFIFSSSPNVIGEKSINQPEIEHRISRFRVDHVTYYAIPRHPGVRVA